VPISSAVTSSAIANDLVIRVYGRTQTLGTTFNVDRATVTGSGADGSFELFPPTRIDAADNSPATLPWSLTADDNVVFTNGSAWQTAYSANRYLKATFPAYVPSGSTIQSVTLTHVYRSNSANRPVCVRYETFAGATALGTHGNTTAGYSCSPSNTADVTDTVSLTEVNTVAEVNSLAVRIHEWRTGSSATSRTDQIRLSVTYVK
jgi:hypothetical protein